MTEVLILGYGNVDLQLLDCATVERSPIWRFAILISRFVIDDLVMSPTRALASRDCRLPRRRQNCHQFVCFLLKGCEGRPVRLAGDGEFVKPSDAFIRFFQGDGELGNELRPALCLGMLQAPCPAEQDWHAAANWLPINQLQNPSIPIAKCHKSPNLQQSSDQAIANSAIHDLHIGRSFLMRDSSVTHMLSIRGKKE